MLYSPTISTESQHHEEPIKYPSSTHRKTINDPIHRAAQALQLLRELAEEKQTMLARCWRTHGYERLLLQSRLQQIEVAMARALEERRRARAGAPPAPSSSESATDQLSPAVSTPTLPLSDDLRDAIKQDYDKGRGLSATAIADKYHLTYHQVLRVVRGENPRPYPTAKLSEQQVRDILHYYVDNEGQRGVITELAKRFAVRKSTISDIVRRRSWRDIEI